MKLFISWSGDRSREFAEALSDWLPFVTRGVESWISSRDMSNAGFWIPKLLNQLKESQSAIICLTKENINAHWILFELGAISKGSDAAKIYIYLLDIKPNELKPTDIEFWKMFQLTTADELGTLKMLNDINSASSSQWSKEQINEAFKRFWPKLKESLDNIPEPYEDTMKKMVKDFEAYEVADGNRLDLALLPETIKFYTDVVRKIDYGSVFAFALGNNPEVLITFEKYPDGISCELVRIGGAEMHVSWKSKEIWKSGPGGGKPDENISSSYVSFKYDDLVAGKPLDYLHEISIKPQITLLGAEPLLIDGIEDKVKIKPDFLEWESCSMLFWVQITQDFINSKDNKYLFLYTSDARDETNYPNGFYLGIKFSHWELAIKGPDPQKDPQHEKQINFSNSDVNPAWNLFVIRLEKTSRTIKLDIFDVRSENKFVSIDEFIGSEGWPENVQGHFFELGGWTDSYPDGISSLDFYKFRLYKGILSDDEIDYIFQSERNIVQKFLK